MSYGLGPIDWPRPAPHPVREMEVSGEPDGHTLTSEVSPDDSVLKHPTERKPECNNRGVLLDRHVWNKGRCERCGAQKVRT